MTQKERISDIVTIPSDYVTIDGVKIHYLEAGTGDPIVFLHGIPTSSYLWRNVMPHLTSLGRCIAPDLVGFGKSDKPDSSYTIDEHIKFIERFIEAKQLKNITFVMHGWGSVIGFHYAMTHQSNCKGLAFYEAFLRSTSGDDISLPYQEQLLALQDEGGLVGSALNGSTFVDQILPQNVMRTLTPVELESYRAPFTHANTQKALLQYIRELPNGTGQQHTEQLIQNYSKALTKSKLPKLMLYSVPGFITTMATLMWAKENLPNLEIVDIGEELHLAQESNPDLIGETVSIWLQGVEAMALHNG